MFHLPAVIWKLMNWQSGVQIKTLVGMAVNCVDDSQEKREDKIKKLAWYFRTAIEKKIPKAVRLLLQSEEGAHPVSPHWQSSLRRYLINVYIVIKLLSSCSTVSSAPDYDFYGLGVLRDLWNNHDWRHSGHFPRVTLCDFNVRVIGNSHPRTLQCVLVVNLLNEKIFVFLWFMLLFVAVSTWSSFFNDYIDSDGAFLLRMIGKNAGEPVLKELLHAAFTAVGVSVTIEAIRLQICGSGCGGCGGGGGGGGDPRAADMAAATAGAGSRLSREQVQGGRRREQGRLTRHSPVIPQSRPRLSISAAATAAAAAAQRLCGVGGGAASSAPWPVLVARMRPHMILPQPPGLINKGPLIRVGHAAPLQSQLLADLGVVQPRIRSGKKAALTAAPHHEGIHGSLDSTVWPLLVRAAATGVAVF
uniref:Innexin n=1 Tax=Macrostomum lignano TaxID=282301 RepID=A0A1I8FA97_9PLAT